MKKIIITTIILILGLTIIVFYKNSSLTNKDKLLIEKIYNKEFNITSNLTNNVCINNYVKESIKTFKKTQNYDVLSELNSFNTKKYKENLKSIENSIDLNYKLYDEVKSYYNNYSFLTKCNKKKYNSFIKVYETNVLSHYIDVINDNISSLEAEKEALMYLYKNKKYWNIKDGSINFKNSNIKETYSDIISVITKD